MSQPPWENQPQQGWEPPAQPQRPGRNQGPYPQPGPDGYPQQYPAQYPAPQGGHGSGHDGGYDTGQPYDPYDPYAQRDPYPQQNPYPPRDPYAQRDPYPPQDRGRPGPRDYPPEPPRRGGGSRTAGIVGVCMLLVIGVATGAVLLTRHKDSGNAAAPQTPDVTATAGVSDSATSDPFPSSASSSPSAPPSTSASASSSAPDQSSSSSAPAVTGPAALDSAATDKTPFTSAALFAKNFTDEKNVAYTLKAAALKPCDKIGDSVVTPIVKTAKCTHFMAASWIDASGRIVVSAMVIPYPDATTAKKIQDKLGSAARTGDYNQWCPPAGQTGADVCTKLTATATREGMAGAYHRYMLITTAVFVDLRTDPGQRDWLSSAANGAFQNILPGS